MRKILIRVLCLALFFATTPARAEVLYALAMHGTPKYSADFTHVDYANPDAPKGGTLRQAAIGSFDSLNPFAIKGKAAQGLNYVHDRLMQRVWDESFTLYPMISQKVDVPADRSSITIFIDPRAKFQDGSPITADDVIFSFETLRDQGRPNMRKVYKLVKSAEKRDDHTVHFTLGPGYDRETVMIVAMMPVLSKAWWTGKTFDASTLDTPVASGPYKIATVDPGHSITYERIKDYWATDLPVNKGQYNFDKIVFDYYRDDTVAFEAFKSGQLDLRREWDANKWAKGYNVPTIQSGEFIKETLAHGRPERVNSLIFNTRRPPFDDIHVREALGLMLDFKWLNDNLYYGLYKQVNSYYPNSLLAAPDAPALPQTGTPTLMRENQRKADQLLKTAGWVVKDGKRVNEKTGAAFDFEILLGTPDDEKMALSFTRSLQKLGITANVRVLDSAAFLGRLNDYDFDMMAYYWLSTLSPGSEQILYWGCEAAKQQGRWNYPGICDPDVDALAKKVAEATTREDLVSTVQSLDRTLLAGHYMVPLYYPGADFVTRRKTIHRPEQIPLYGMVLETWWASDSIENRH